MEHFDDYFIAPTFYLQYRPKVWVACVRSVSGDARALNLV